VVELGRELLIFVLERCGDRPVFRRLERTNLALAFHQQSKRHGLHASGRESLLHGLPEHRARLVSHEAVEYAARLLCVHLFLVDVTGVRDRAHDRVLRDLVEEHTPDRRRRLALDLALHMPGNRLTLAIGVGRDEHGSGALGRGFQVGDCLFLARDGHVFGLESIFEIDAERLGREVADMADRRLYAVRRPEVLADGLCFCRRLDDDERLPIEPRAVP